MFLRKKLSFKLLGMPSFSKLDWGSYMISIVETAPKKAGVIIFFYKVSFS